MYAGQKDAVCAVPPFQAQISLKASKAAGGHTSVLLQSPFLSVALAPMTVLVLHKLASDFKSALSYHQSSASGIGPQPELFQRGLSNTFENSPELKEVMDNRGSTILESDVAEESQQSGRSKTGSPSGRDECSGEVEQVLNGRGFVGEYPEDDLRCGLFELTAMPASRPGDCPYKIPNLSQKSQSSACSSLKTNLTLSALYILEATFLSGDCMV